MIERSSNANVAERFNPRVTAVTGAGDVVWTELRLVIGASTDGGPLILALFGVDADQSVVFSWITLTLAFCELITMGDDVDCDREESAVVNECVDSIESDGFSVLIGSVFVRMDGSEWFGGVARGRRWNGIKVDRRELAVRHNWHRHVRRFMGSVMDKQMLLDFESCLQEKTNETWSNICEHMLSTANIYNEYISTNFLSGSMQLFRCALISNWLERFFISWCSFLFVLIIKSNGEWIVDVDGAAFDVVDTLLFFIETASVFLVVEFVSLLPLISSVGAILYT
jgi:hypothetical protein